MKVTSVVPKESSNGKGDFLLTIRALNARQDAVGPGGFAYVPDDKIDKIIQGFANLVQVTFFYDSPRLTLFYRPVIGAITGVHRGLR